MTPSRARLHHRTTWVFLQRPDLGDELISMAMDMGRDEWLEGTAWGRDDPRFNDLHEWLTEQRVPEFYMGTYPSAQMYGIGMRNDTPKARLIRRRDWMVANGWGSELAGWDMSNLQYMDRDFDPRLDALHRKLDSLNIPHLFIEDFLYPVHWQHNIL